MADDSGIDPRYAAQFQRGFDPARHRVAPVAPPPRDPAAPVRLPGGPVSHAERVVERPVVPAVPLPVASPGPQPSAEPELLPEEVEEPRRAFRVDWLLPALGVALLLAAVWVFQDTLTVPDAFGGGMEDYFVTLVRSSLPGPLLVASVVSFSAWLVLRAVRGWRR